MPFRRWQTWLPTPEVSLFFFVRLFCLTPQAPKACHENVGGKKTHHRTFSPSPLSSSGEERRFKLRLSLIFRCVRARFPFTQREHLTMKVCEHLKAARWRFVLFYAQFSLRFSSLGARTRSQNRTVPPSCHGLYHMAGVCIFSPEAEVVINVKWRETTSPEKQFGCHSVHANFSAAIFCDFIDAVYHSAHATQEKGKKNHLG